MLTFFEFVTEELQSKPIKSKGISAERHTGKYITPYLPGGSKHAEGTHTVAADVGHLKAGDKVTIHGHEVKDGTHHATVSKEGSNKKIQVPTNKLVKPFAQKNRGLEGEGHLVKHLNKHGLMSGSGAGATAGNDFHLIDKRGAKPTRISGSEGVSDHGVQGEHKSSIKTAAFGQLTLNRHPETGKWHISDKARARRPEYASQIEKATVTVNGKKKSLLDHLNDTEPHGTVNKSGFKSDKTSLEPAHSYMRDHHVDVVHVDSHGTFRAGLSNQKDRHKLNLPKMEGEGHFVTRQKGDNPNSRNVQFSISKLNKSDVHIGTEEGANEIKKRLGH